MFTFEISGIKDLSKGINPIKFQREFDRQQIDTVRKARTLVSQQVRRRYDVPARLFGGTKFSKVRIQKLGNSRILRYKGHMIGLEKMKAKQYLLGTGVKRKNSKKQKKKWNVKVTVKRGNRRIVQGGFFGKGKNSGATFVFKRVKNEKTKKGKDKLKRTFTISIAHMVAQVPVAKNGAEIARHFNDGFAKRLIKLR